MDQPSLEPQIGSYVPVRFLAHWTLGERFIARPLHAGAQEPPVILDRLWPELQSFESFDDEISRIERWRKISHPMLARGIDVDDQGDRPVIVSEFFEGRSLEALIQRRESGHESLPMRAVLEMGHQVAQALSALHDAKEGNRALHFVHGGINPTRILLDSKARVKVLGGWSSRLEMRLPWAVPPRTVVYQAPEEVWGRPMVDRRADLYSLGVVLFEGLCGRFCPPEDPQRFIRRVLRREVEETGAFTSLPQQVQGLLHRLLSIDPFVRPSDARTVAEDLRNILESLGGEVAHELKETAISTPIAAVAPPAPGRTTGAVGLSIPAIPKPEVSSSDTTDQVDYTSRATTILPPVARENMRLRAAELQQAEIRAAGLDPQPLPPRISDVRAAGLDPQPLPPRMPEAPTQPGRTAPELMRSVEPPPAPAQAARDFVSVAPPPLAGRSTAPRIVTPPPPPLAGGELEPPFMKEPAVVREAPPAPPMPPAPPAAPPAPPVAPPAPPVAPPAPPMPPAPPAAPPAPAHDEVFEEGDEDEDEGPLALQEELEGNPRGFLIFREGSSKEFRYPLFGDVVTLGRSSQNTYQILSEVKASRFHCELQFENGRWTLIDKRSTNGTYVNGQPIQVYELKGREKVNIGFTTFRFLLADSHGRPVDAAPERVEAPKAQQKRRKLRAALVRNEGTPREIRLEVSGDVFLIGRGTGNSLQLEDPMVAPSHCEIRYQDGQYLVEDHLSEHGTLVNGFLVDTLALDGGELITVGEETMRFVLF